MTWSENSGSFKNDGFPYKKKQINSKKIKFGLLIDFDIEIRLSGLNRSFLT
jgi:hypothetical protein